MTTVLLVMIAMATPQGLATGQSSSLQQEAPSAPSITVLDASGASPASFVQPGPLNLEKTTPCSLRVPDANPQPSAEGDGTTPTGKHLSYLPLSNRCKFRLFLKTTYSPYTIASAGFEATEAQATDQWPHYGGGMQGWGKRFGATLANTESRRFIQGYALSTILHQDPRYFPSPKKGVFSRAWYSATRVVITRNDDGKNAFNTSEFLGALLTSALQNRAIIYLTNHVGFDTVVAWNRNQRPYSRPSGISPMSKYASIPSPLSAGQMARSALHADTSSTIISRPRSAGSVKSATSSSP